MHEGLLCRARQVADCGLNTKPEQDRKSMRIPTGRLQHRPVRAEGTFERFTMGDSVLLLPDKKRIRSRGYYRFPTSRTSKD